MKFLVTGEGWPAKRISNSLVNSNSLAGIVTDLKNQDSLAYIAIQNNVPALDYSVFQDRSLANLPAADWLVSVNNPVVLGAGVLKQFYGHAINLHNGPLPEYAGRHVTQWGIRNGEKVFSTSVHHMETGIDAGNLIADRTFSIKDTDTGLTVFDRSFKVGVKLLIEIMEQIKSGATVPGTPQDLTRRKVYKHQDSLDGYINWDSSPRHVVDFIRAGDYRPLKSPTYTAVLEIFQRTFLVYKAVEVSSVPGIKPGSVVEISPEGPVIACRGGCIRLTDVTLDGTKMNHADWLECAGANESAPLMTQDDHRHASGWRHVRHRPVSD